MEALQFNVIIAYVFGLILLYVIGWILVVPLKVILKLIYNGILGGIALIVINVLGGFIGISIGINPITALIVGALGMPGVVLLLFLQIALRT